MARLHPAQAALKEVVKARQVGSWALTEPLGRGGQGTTWRAIWKTGDQSFTRIALGGGHLQRSVIKLMLPPSPEEVPISAAHFDAWLVQEGKVFLLEAEVLRRIDSPYIPDVFQAALQPTDSGWEVPWFATELISGRSLTEQLGMAGPMDQNHLLDLAHDILSALVAVHEAGLVHLDLKPDNVMLEPGKARLIDFGLVTKANQKGRLGGTPGYFTPEQLDELLEEIDFAPAADIFKLGITLSIAAGVRLSDLWGTDPYGEDQAVRSAMRKGPRLTSVRPVLRDMIAPMLAFDSRARPAAATALEQVRDLLPVGSSKSSGKSKASTTTRTNHMRLPQSAERPGRGAPIAQKPTFAVPPMGAGNVNVGAKVVVVDRLGLDWSGVVVGIDTKRPGHILVKHDSTRGADNVRSYPLHQVVRGAPLK